MRNCSKLDFSEQCNSTRVMEASTDRSLLSDLYDRDYYLWLKTTSQLLRDRQLERIDLEHLAEELEDMGKRQKRAIESNLEILLMHLLKYQYQPEKQTNSWRYTIY